MEIYKGEKTHKFKDKDDELAFIRQEAFNKGMEHQIPSRQTIELIDGLKLELNTFKIFMENITEKIEEGFAQNTKEHQELAQKVDEKAGKWVEKVIWWAIASIGTGIFSITTAVVIFLIERGIIK